MVMGSRKLTSSKSEQETKKRKKKKRKRKNTCYNYHTYFVLWNRHHWSQERQTDEGCPDHVTVRTGVHRAVGGGGRLRGLDDGGWPRAARDRLPGHDFLKSRRAIEWHCLPEYAKNEKVENFQNGDLSYNQANNYLTFWDYFFHNSLIFENNYMTFWDYLFHNSLTF